MEGMAVVVAALALAAEPADEVVPGEKRAFLSLRHRAISIPSCAMRQPARSTAARSAESSLRTGFVLLRWM
jgi:hypothetical protein